MQFNKDIKEIQQLFNSMAKLFEIVFIMKYRKDQRFEYIQFSKQAKELANLTDEALGLTIHDCYRDEVANFLHDQYLDAINKGQPVTFVDQMNLEDHKTLKKAETTLIPLVIDAEDYVIAFTRDITELENKKNEVFEQKERFHSLFKYNNDSIIATDVNGTIQMINEACITKLHLIENKVIDRSLEQIFPAFTVFNRKAVKSPLEEEVLLEINEKPIIALVKRVPIFVKEKHLGFYFMIHDITFQREVIIANDEMETRYRRLMDMSPQMIFLVQDEYIIYTNLVALQLLETSNDVLVGKKIAAFIKEQIGSFIKDGDVAILQKLNGEKVFITLKKSVVFLNKQKLTLYSCTDISNQIAVEKELVFMENFDPLTKLYNRKSVDQLINTQLSSSESFHFVLFNIDKFKLINDLIGTTNADLILVEFANRLTTLVNKTLIARMNGDEFVVILPEEQSPHLFIDQAQKLIDHVFETNNGPLHVTASTAVSKYPEHGKNAEQLYLNATKAMSLAKISGVRQIKFYTEEMREVFTRKYKLENELKKSLQLNHFHVVYQPKINLQQKPIELEALIRWQHPDLGMISPAEFIPIAEESGLIIEIGKFVIDQVCRDLKQLHDKYRSLRIAINLSPKQFLDPHLEQDILATINKWGLHPKYLEFEITETTIMTDPNKAIDILNSLKKSGITIAIDDFGTSFSSFSYLKRLPVDSIKIDRIFISGISDNEKDRRLVEGLIDLAHRMNLEITAEGVETQEQLQFLQSKNCDTVQGFYFARPENIVQLMKTLEHLNK